MSKQPLTPRNAEIILVSDSIDNINHKIQAYNVPSDPGDITPTITIHKISSYEEFMSFISTAPSATLPWAVVEPCLNRKLIMHMEAYFDANQSVSSCFDMVNNEYAIRRDQVQRASTP